MLDSRKFVIVPGPDTSKQSHAPTSLGEIVRPVIPQNLSRGSEPINVDVECTRYLLVTSHRPADSTIQGAEESKSNQEAEDGATAAPEDAAAAAAAATAAAVAAVSTPAQLLAKAEGAKARQRASAAHNRFRSTLSDALSALAVLCAFEAAGETDQFCRWVSASLSSCCLFTSQSTQGFHTHTCLSGLTAVLSVQSSQVNRPKKVFVRACNPSRVWRPTSLISGP